MRDALTLRDRRKSKPPRRRGLTAVELVLVVIACAIGFVVLLLALTDGRASIKVDPPLSDLTQIREFHQTLVIWSQDHNGAYPRPAITANLPPVDDAPPRINHCVNTTANLCSMLIMQNFFNPDFVISPLERSEHVREKLDYNYDAYDPASGVHWDPTFKADLHSESNTSYAHLPIFGARASMEWRLSQSSDYAVLGSRGPRDGVLDPDSITCPDGAWSGNIVFNDNHVELLEAMTPEQQRPRLVDGVEKPDNIFAMEDGPHGADAILSFTRAMTEDGPELQHD